MVVKNTKQKEYVDVLFSNNFIRLKMKIIKSKLHRIGTYNACKISSSRFNDIMHILNDGSNSLAYFYKNIKSQ